MTDRDDDFWGEPIDVYTDRDALDDGILIDISDLHISFEGQPVNRMTCTLFADLRPFFPLAGFERLQAATPPDEELINCDMGAMARAIRTKLDRAQGEGRIRTLPPEIWLVQNEVNGWTLMNPSDY